MYSKVEQTRDLQYCTYIIEDFDEEPKPMTKHEQLSFGPFLWFGTSRDEADIYGPYCFEFQLKNVMKKYQQARGSEKTLCYRAGGTLLYKQEIAHVVIICCKEDKDYQSYPLIEATSTKYFKPPIKFVRPKVESTESFMCKRQKVERLQCSSSDDVTIESSYHITQDGTLSYETLPSEELSIPAMVLSSADTEGERHEHVVLAFYLPDSITLQLTNQDGKLSRATHQRFCVKSSGKRRCRFTQFDNGYIHYFNKPVDDYK